MPLLKACFGIGGKTFLGRTLARKLRATSWDEDRGVFSTVLSGEKGETYLLELSREELANFLTYYRPRAITNHFGGDLSRAEEWLQTSRRILADPSNRAERPEVAKLPKFQVPNRGTFEKAQTSSRIRMNGLWLISTLKEMAKTKGKRKKVGSKRKKFKMGVDRG